MEIQKLIGKVCDRSWGLKEADVVCKQLGCGSALKTSYQVYSKIQATNTWLFLSNCNGNETSIWDCKNWQWGGLSCEHYDEAKVTCSGKTFNQPVKKLHSNFILLHGAVQFSQHYYLRVYLFSIVYCCLLCDRLIGNKCMGLFLGFLSSSINLCVCFCLSTMLF